MFDLKSQHSYNFNSPTTHTNGSYNNITNWDLSAKIKKSAQNYENHMRVNDPDNKTDSYSPSLWKSSSQKNDGNLSPNSRSRAIAKLGQKELMEMAQNVPESCYELTLRDIVERPKLDDEEMCLFDERNKKSVKEIVKRQESCKKVEKKMDRVISANLENSGLFLKMNISIPFIRSKRKKNLAKSNNTRVSPKVETLGWFSGSSGNESVESGATTTNNASSNSTNSTKNNSNNSQKIKGWSFGCWTLAFSRKNKRKSN